MNITHSQYKELKSLLLEYQSLQLENNAMLKRIDAKINPETLSPDEVCELVGISKSTYKRKVATGIIPQHKKGNARNSPTYVKRADIEKLQAQGKI